MKALKIFEEVYNEDVIGKNFSRRETLTKGLGFGLKVALASLPFSLLETFSNKAYAGGPSNSTVVGIRTLPLRSNTSNPLFIQQDSALQG